ncbi:hypothetical protein D9M73_229480 [compost metagenome]
MQVVDVQLQFDPIAHLPSGGDFTTTDQWLVLTCFEVHIRFAAQVFDPGHDDADGILGRFEGNVLRANPQAQQGSRRQVRAIEGQGGSTQNGGVDQAGFARGIKARRQEVHFGRTEKAGDKAACRALIELAR